MFSSWKYWKWVYYSREMNERKQNNLQKNTLFKKRRNPFKLFLSECFRILRRIEQIKIRKCKMQCLILKIDLFFPIKRKIKERERAWEQRYTKELLIKSLIFKGKLGRKLFFKIKFSFRKFGESAAANCFHVDGL